MEFPIGTGLRDLEAELEKLAMDARRAPEWVIQAHLPDERAQVRIDLRAPSSIPGRPAPVAAKPSAMPANQRLRPNDLKDRQD